MNRLRQVVHVALKDLRGNRWRLAGYVALIGWTTVQAIVPAGGLSFVWPFIVLLLGGVIAAVVVQADSPYRADAFWASRPLDGMAVFGAKLCVMLLLVAVALAGEFAALLAHDSPAVASRGVLAGGALSMALFLSTAAVIAALTPDLRTFLLVSIGLVVVENVILLSAMGASGELRTIRLSGRSLEVITLIATLLLLAWLYRSRRRGRAILLGVVLLAATLAIELSGIVGPIGANAWIGLPVAQSPDGEPPVALQAGLEASVRIPEAGGDPVVAVALAGGSPYHAYSLASVTIRFETRDGRIVDVSSDRNRMWLDMPTVRLDSAVEIPGTARGAWSYGLSLELTRDQRSDLASGIAAVTVEGRMEVFEQRIASSVRLLRGARVAHDGRRVRVLDVEDFVDETTITLSVSSVAGVGSHGLGEPGSNQFLVPHVLHDASRAEAIRLTSGGSSSGSVGFVIPGSGSRRQVIELSTPTSLGAGDAQRPHEPWAGRSNLLSIEWRSIGSYPVTATVSRPAG
jgi:hypothetical protein